jgi:hypothetical protein
MQTAAAQTEIIYPETDGEPIAQNTQQAEVMMTLKENLDALFADRDDVFVAIDHFWYPVKGHPEIRQAPDVMVVLGRPKGHRGSYKQWEEGNIPRRWCLRWFRRATHGRSGTRSWRFMSSMGLRSITFMTLTRVSGVGMCGRAGSWQRLVRWRVG